MTILKTSLVGRGCRATPGVHTILHGVGHVHIVYLKMLRTFVNESEFLDSIDFESHQGPCHRAGVRSMEMLLDFCAYAPRPGPPTNYCSQPGPLFERAAL